MPAGEPAPDGGRPYDQAVAGKELPRPIDDVVHRELDGQAVIVHLGTNRIYALNPTGARFWTLLVEGHEREAIRARLLEEFDVEPHALDVEIDALLTELEDAGLVA